MTIPILRPGESLPPELPFAYTIAREGFNLKKRGPFFEACVRVDAMPALEEEREFFTFTGPKIPKPLFSQALAFFEAVHRAFNSEAAALLVFENEAWDLVVPSQTATAISVKYEVPAGRRLAGSIHSHPRMSARFSSTDDRDQRDFEGIHLVVSNAGFTRPEVSCAAVVAGRQIEVDPRVVLAGYEEGLDFPEEWLAQVAALRLPATPSVGAQPDRETHPVCSSCVHAPLCDIDPPEHASSCLFFQPDFREEGIPWDR